MDAMMSSLVVSVLDGYFQTFFNNFNRDDFKLNLSGSETTTSLYKLEVKQEILQELVGMTNYEFLRCFVNTVTVKLRPTSIRSQPIQIILDKIEVSVKEPTGQLKPIPKVIEEFLKKFLPQKTGKGSYGFVEKLIDAIRIDIRQITVVAESLGKYKTTEQGSWTPPKVNLEIRDVSLYTTNFNWEVVDLKQTREFNRNKPEIYVFKELRIESVSLFVDNSPDMIPIVSNLPILGRVTIRKTLENVMLGLSTDLTIEDLRVSYNVVHAMPMVNLLEGVTSCLFRPDSPAPPKSAVPHMALLSRIVVRQLSVKVFEETGRGLELLANNIDVCLAWPENSPSYEKFVEVSVPYVAVREFAILDGSEKATYLLQPCITQPYKDPATFIPPLPKSLHPTYVPPRYERPPVFYLKGLFRHPPQRPLFDQEIQGLLNPVEVSLTEESSERLLELLIIALPFFNQYLKRADQKPSLLEGILIAEPRSPFENLVSIKFEVGGIYVILPSPPDSKYAKFCINITNTMVLSHPQLPSSSLFDEGFCVGEVNSTGDLINTRTDLKHDSLASSKFKVLAKLEATVQSSPVSDPETVLEVPQITIDAEVFVGQLADLTPATDESTSSSSPVQKKPLKLAYVEVVLFVKEIFGRLSQQQYKTICRRIDETIPLFPVLHRLRMASRQTQQPDIPTLFAMRIEHGEFCILYDQSDEEQSKAAEVAGVAATAIELLSGSEFNGFDLCIEARPHRHTIKTVLKSLQAFALPNTAPQSPLYNPNLFVSTANSAVALLQLRVDRVPPPELSAEAVAATHSVGRIGSEHIDGALFIQRSLEAAKKRLTAKARLTDRPKLILRLNGLQSGINANPIMRVASFFLNTDRTFQDIFRSITMAQASASKLELGEFVSVIDEVDPDTDLSVLVNDTKLFFVRDITDDARSHGNISVTLKRLHLDRHADSETSFAIAFQVDELAVSCNKEQAGQIVSQNVFTPLSIGFSARHSILSEDLHMTAEAKGIVDKIEINISPAHSEALWNLLSGIRTDNIKELANGIARYFEKKEETALLVGAGGAIAGAGAPTSGQLKSVMNPASSKLEDLQGWLTRAYEHLERAREDKETLTKALKELQPADFLVKAIKSGWMNLHVNNQWQRRFFVLADTYLYVLENDKAKAAQAKLLINNTAALELIDNFKNCFRVNSGKDSLVLTVDNDAELTQWINELLRVQCASLAPPSITVNLDAIGNLRNDLQNLARVREELAQLIDEVKDGFKLHSRLRALEDDKRHLQQRVSELEKQLGGGAK